MNKLYINKINIFVFPLFVQFIVSYFINVTDQAIIARISTPAFNSVSLISSTLTMIAGLLGCITIVFNIKGGKKIGENNLNGMLYEFYSSLLLSFILGILFLIIFLLSHNRIFTTVYNLNGETLIQANLFSVPMSFYVLFQLFLFAFGTYFKIQNQTKYILWGSMASAILDVSLDVFFVSGFLGLPRLGTSMVGWSTIIAMFVNLLIYILLIRKELSIKLVNTSKYLKNCKQHFIESLPLIAQEIFEGTIFVIIINMIIIRIGEKEFASYNIIMALLGFIFIFKHIYGSATLSLVSISAGEKDINNLFLYPKISTIITIVFYIVFSLIFYTFNESLPKIISEDIFSQTLTSNNIVYFLLAYLFSSWAYIYKNALQALQEYSFILWSSALVNILALVIMFFLTHILNLSLIGIAISLFINEIILGIIYFTKYKLSIKKLFLNTQIITKSS